MRNTVISRGDGRDGPSGPSFPEHGWRVERISLECLKGVWRMPWRMEAMKDVARCDKPRGAVSRL